MKQALVRLPNESPECNDIKLGDSLRLLRTHRGRTIGHMFLNQMTLHVGAHFVSGR